MQGCWIKGLWCALAVLTTLAYSEAAPEVACGTSTVPAEPQDASCTSPSGELPGETSLLQKKQLGMARSPPTPRSQAMKEFVRQVLVSQGLRVRDEVEFAEYVANYDTATAQIVSEEIAHSSWVEADPAASLPTSHELGLATTGAMMAAPPGAGASTHLGAEASTASATAPATQLSPPTPLAAPAPARAAQSLPIVTKGGSNVAPAGPVREPVAATAGVAPTSGQHGTSPHAAASTDLYQADEPATFAVSSTTTPAKKETTLAVDSILKSLNAGLTTPPATVTEASQLPFGQQPQSQRPRQQIVDTGTTGNPSILVSMPDGTTVAKNEVASATAAPTVAAMVANVLAPWADAGGTNLGLGGSGSNAAALAAAASAALSPLAAAAAAKTGLQAPASASSPLAEAAAAASAVAAPAAAPAVNAASTPASVAVPPASSVASAATQMATVAHSKTRAQEAAMPAGNPAAPQAGKATAAATPVAPSVSVIRGGEATVVDDQSAAGAAVQTIATPAAATTAGAAASSTLANPVLVDTHVGTPATAAAVVTPGAAQDTAMTVSAASTIGVAGGTAKSTSDTFISEGPGQARNAQSHDSTASQAASPGASSESDLDETGFRGVIGRGSASEASSWIRRFLESRGLEVKNDGALADFAASLLHSSPTPTLTTMVGQLQHDSSWLALRQRVAEFVQEGASAAMPEHPDHPSGCFDATAHPVPCAALPALPVQPLDVASRAPISEEGYQMVAKLRHPDAMKVFSRRLVKMEGGRVQSEGDLSGMVPFYDGEVSVQSFAKLRQELLSARWTNLVVS